MTPEYYKFPSGVQPIEIARYLNSNGGQILGYIARSTRIDGKNKHANQLDDLMKARDLLHDEIARVQELYEAQKSFVIHTAEGGCLSGGGGSTRFLQKEKKP